MASQMTQNAISHRPSMHEKFGEFATYSKDKKLLLFKVMNNNDKF